MKKVKRRLASKPKLRKLKDEFDEEISEDEDWFEEPETKKGKKGGKKEEGGELWKYIHETAPEPEDDEEGSESADLPPSNGQVNGQDYEDGLEKATCVDRLEDNLDLDGTILDFDQMEENDSSYKWITQSSESKEAYKKLVKKFKQIEADVPEVLKAESQSRASKLERKSQYQSVKKHITKKWAPIVSQIAKNEGLVYGEDTERADPTCGTLYSTFKPETEFEKELAASADDKLREVEGKALARAVLAREQKRNKRINRIKSKRWHKRQKQRDLQIAAKLLSKIDDPELAQEIKTTFERKRAEKRILRKKEAQSKWAKMALRYGGKDLLKEISLQNQNLRNDHQIIDKVTRGGEEDSEDESDDEDPEDDREQTLRESQQDKLNVILDPTVPIPEKGLFNLTFMKNAIINKREQELNGQDEEDEVESDGDDEEPDKVDVDDEVLDYNVIVNHEGVEVDEQIRKFNKMRDERAPEFTKELERARKEVESMLSNDQFTEFYVLEDKTTATVKSIAYDTSLYTDKTGMNSDSAPEVALRMTADKPQDRNEKNDSHTNNLDSGIKEPPKKSKRDEKKERNNHLGKKGPSTQNMLDEFIDSLEVAKEDERNKSLVKEMFVARPDAEEFLESSEDEAEEKDPESMPGWGSWTGEGIDPEPKEQEPEKQKRKSRVKVTKKKDPKLAKYYIHNLPHPFNNRHEYNSKMDIPIGPEWNTMNMHKKLIQPKTSVKIGSVIMPLGLGNNKHKQLLRDYGKRIIKNRTHSRL